MSGRPRALNELKCRKVCALVSAGCSVEAAAHQVGCNAVTIRRESLRNPEFCEQLRQARRAAQSAPLPKLHKPRKADRIRTRPATIFQPPPPNQSARPEPILIGTDEVKILVETIVKSKFNQPNDAEIVDRLLMQFDAVMAQLRATIKPVRASPTEIDAPEKVATCDSAHKIEQQRTERAV